MPKNPNHRARRRVKPGEGKTVTEEYVDLEDTPQNEEEAAQVDEQTEVEEQVEETTDLTPELNIPAPAPSGSLVLRRPQLRVLAALADGSALTRKEIAFQSKVDNASLTGYIGAVNEVIRAKNDREFYPCLLTLGYIREDLNDEGGKNVVRYSITEAGRECLRTSKS